MTDSYHVFLSCADKDAQLMSEIRDALRVASLTVYVDASTGEGSLSSNRLTEEKMRSAYAFVFVLTPNAYTSEWMKKKFDFAASLKKPLFLVLARGDAATAIPPTFASHPYVDIRNNYSAIRREIIPEILNIPGVKNTLSPVEIQQPVPVPAVAIPEQPRSPSEHPLNVSESAPQPPARKKGCSRLWALLIPVAVMIWLIANYARFALNVTEPRVTREQETAMAQRLTDSDDQIAFQSNRDGDFDIYVMNANGSSLINLTADSSATDGVPAWSPDGTQIAFSSDRDGNGEIYIMNADGSNPVKLTNNSANDSVPTWSPDGTQIAFNSLRDGNGEIYVMNADGSNPVNLTNTSANESNPSWSSDGTQIAFNSLRDDDVEIYVMNPDGTNPVNLTNGVNTNAFASWSPNGTWLAFISERDGNAEVYVTNTTGTNPVRLTDNTADELFPAWSPDSAWIAFTSNRDGNREIYVMNADGSAQVNLSTNDAEDLFPAWRP